MFPHCTNVLALFSPSCQLSWPALQHILPHDKILQGQELPASHLCLSCLYQTELCSALRVGGLESLLGTTLPASQPLCILHFYTNEFLVKVICQPRHVPAQITHCPLPAPDLWHLDSGSKARYTALGAFVHTPPPTILSCIFISVQQRIIWPCILYGQTINT